MTATSLRTRDVDFSSIGVTTEIDETNIASRRLLEGLGARKVGESFELVLRKAHT
jgi:hypothetical protein